MTTRPGRKTGIHLLTDKGIRASLAAATPADELSLPDGNGLYLRVRSGLARWYLRELNPETGKRTWAPVFEAGRYPERSLADAREAVRVARMRAADEGADTTRLRERDRAEAAASAEAERQAAAKRVSVSKLFDIWADTELKPHIKANKKRGGRKDGGEEIRSRFSVWVFPKHGQRAAESIESRDVLAILDAATNAGKDRTAGLLYQELKQMFAFAGPRGYVSSQPVPLRAPRTISTASVERDRALSPEEVTQLVQALPVSGLAPRAAAGLLLILATGVRVGELLGATWSDAAQPVEDLLLHAADAEVKYGVIDREAGTWYLPDTKNGRDHTIHLSRFALQQVDKLAALRVPSISQRDREENPTPPGWLFPEKRGPGPVGAPSLGKQIRDRQCAPDQRLANRTKNVGALALPGGKWTLHDLRRTAATLMARLGVSSDVIDACLNHMEESKVRRIYIRHRRGEEQVAAFDRLGKLLEQLAQPTADGAQPPSDRPALRRVA